MRAIVIAELGRGSSSMPCVRLQQAAGPRCSTGKEFCQNDWCVSPIFKGSHIVSRASNYDASVPRQYHTSHLCASQVWHETHLVTGQTTASRRRKHHREARAHLDVIRHGATQAVPHRYDTHVWHMPAIVTTWANHRDNLCCHGLYILLAVGFVWYISLLSVWPEVLLICAFVGSRGHNEVLNRLQVWHKIYTCHPYKCSKSNHVNHRPYLWMIILLYNSPYGTPLSSKLHNRTDVHSGHLQSHQNGEWMRPSVVRIKNRCLSITMTWRNEKYIKSCE